MQDVHLQLLPSLFRELDLALIAAGIEHPVEFSRLEVLHIDGRSEALLKVRIGGKKRLHPFRFAHKDQHPALVARVV